MRNQRVRLCVPMKKNMERKDGMEKKSRRVVERERKIERG